MHSELSKACPAFFDHPVRQFLRESEDLFDNSMRRIIFHFEL
jgi:hypothetical protein